jgi:hypothetical protein
MSIIMRLRQAWNPEQVAAEIEPLAQALASLADETTEVLSQLQASSQEQAATWSAQQRAAAEAWKQAAAEVGKAAKQAEAAATRMEAAASGQITTLASVAGVAAILSAALAIGFWLLLAPTPETPEVRNTLDPAAVAEILKPAIVDALRRK